MGFLWFPSFFSSVWMIICQYFWIRFGLSIFMSSFEDFDSVADYDRPFGDF